MCGCSCPFMCIWKLPVDVFLTCSLPYLLREGLSLNLYHLSNPADEDIINNTSVLNLRKIDVLVLRFSSVLNKTNGGLDDYLHILSMPKGSDSPCPITI